MSRDTPIRSNIARESLFSSRTSPEKIWVWFCAIRFVMCRQPQQKSGSKQPWSNCYDHHTVVAISLIGVGWGKGSSEVHARELPCLTWWRVTAREMLKSHRKRGQESCYSWNNMGISYGLKSKYARKGNMAGPQQHSSEIKITLVLLMTAELCSEVFVFFQWSQNNYMS